MEVCVALEHKRIYVSVNLQCNDNSNILHIRFASTPY